MSDSNGAPWGAPRPTDPPPPGGAPAPGPGSGPASSAGYSSGPGAPAGYAPGPGPAPGYAPGPGYASPPGYGPPGYGAPGYGPAPGYGGFGYGPAPGYGGFGSATAVRHRPGAGLGVGIAGFLLVVLSLVSFPWISEGGEDATFGDIADSIDAMSSVGAGVDAELAYLEVYTGGLWLAMLGIAALAIVFSTLVVPSSHGGRIAIGFLVGGVIGVVINAVDREGRVAPRLTGALIALACLGMHGMAVYDMFGDEFAPDAAWGVWAGVVGLVLVLVGCLVGTRTERVPAYR